jgi:hypothetical protein
MDQRLHFPHTLGNRAPIWQVLSSFLAPGDQVLEVASGSGEHVRHFAIQQPGIRWFPSDCESDHCQSIDAWCAGLSNVATALQMDVSTQPWPALPSLRAVVAINLIHIAPWSACLGLVAGAARSLAPDGLLYLYGAYKRMGKHTAPSNGAFDRSLRDQNPDWGVRDLESELLPAAAARGFVVAEVVEMPSNNLSVLLRATGETQSGSFSCESGNS